MSEKARAWSVWGGLIIAVITAVFVMGGQNQKIESNHDGIKTLKIDVMHQMDRQERKIDRVEMKIDDILEKM